MEQAGIRKRNIFLPGDKNIPITVVSKKDGTINKEETERINKNNKDFKSFVNNEAFTMGQIFNWAYKQLGDEETGRLIRAADKVSKDKASGGKVKKYGYMGGGKVHGQPRKATYKAG